MTAADSAAPAQGWRASASWVALVSVLPLLLLLPGLLLGSFSDSAVFTLIGQRWLHGDVPYRDLFDHKPPFVYVMTAAAQALLGEGWPAVWGLTLASLGLTGALFGRWLCQRATQWSAFLIAALVLLGCGMYPVAQGGGLTETLSLPIGAGAFVLATGNRPRWMAAGACAGAAVLVSVQWLPLAIPLLVLAWPRPTAVARITVGGLLALAGAAAVIFASGAWDAALEALFTYNAAYLSLSRAADTPGFSAMFASALPLAVLSLLSLRNAHWKRERVAALAWLCVGALAIAVQGRAFGHYVTPLLIPLGVLAIGGTARMSREFMVRWVLALAVAASCGLGLVIGLLLVGQRAPAVGEAVAAIEARSDSADRILVWGLEPELYELSGRAPAGRYPYHLPLTTPGYATAQRVEAWLAGLRANPPRVLVDAETFRSGDQGVPFPPPPPGSAGGRSVDNLADFRRWVDDHYSKSTTPSGWILYDFSPDRTADH